MARPRDPYIKDLPDPICWKIAEKLDGLKKPNWKTLISKMPKTMYDDKAVLRFHMSILRPRGSPTLALLEDLGRKKKTVGQLVAWLKELGRGSDGGSSSSELIDFLERGEEALKELAPSIEHHPESTAVCETGGILRLSVVANGKEPFKYQWFKGNFELKEQTTSSLCIENVSLHDTGYYVCRVANEIDYVYSSWSKIDVVEPCNVISSLSPMSLSPSYTNSNAFNKPLITMHPRSETLNDGDTLVLSADAVGDPAPTLQWYHNERPLIGECSRNLTILSVSHSQHDGFYHFEASNKFTTTKSLKAQITINQYQHHKKKKNLTHEVGEKMKNKEQEELMRNNIDGSELPIKTPPIATTTKTDDFPPQQKAPLSNPRGMEDMSADSSGYSIPSPSAPTGKVALVIGNQNYENAAELGHLVHPVNDSHDIASELQSLDFKVVSLINLKVEDMRNAVRFFCSLLDGGTYALFYFAGHGFEVSGESYMMAVDASAKYRPGESLSLTEVLGPITERNPKLSVLLVDSCRTQPELCRSDPFSSSDSSSRATLQRKNVIIGYGCCARGRVLESPEMKNGYFAHHLLESMANNVKVDDVMFLVSKGIHEDRVLDPATGRTQVVYRHSTVVDDLRLTDAVQESHSISTQMALWQSAHVAPLSPVTALENDHVLVKLIFTPEFSNCLLVQSEVTEKTSCKWRNLLFFLPDRIGGAKVEMVAVTPKEKQQSTQVDDKIVRISNLERLEGDINIHLEIKYETGGFQYKQNAYYCIKEKPLYAKITDVIRNEKLKNNQ